MECQGLSHFATVMVLLGPPFPKGLCSSSFFFTNTQTSLPQVRHYLNYRENGQHGTLKGHFMPPQRN